MAHLVRSRRHAAVLPDRALRLLDPAQLFGDATLGYHIVTICLHALSSFLVAVILRRLAVPGAILAAVIFALHPVQVESVAWITELKNTLSGVFYLGAALAYLRFDERRERRMYGFGLVLFVLALLTKSVTASLPAALLVVFWWSAATSPGRATFDRSSRSSCLGRPRAWSRRGSKLTIVGAHGADYQLTMIERTIVAGRAVWFYLGKLVWPANLIFTYPKWRIVESDPAQYLYPLGVVVLFAALW